MGKAKQDDLVKKSVAIEQFDIAAETADIINKNAAVIEDMIRDQMAAGKDGSDKWLNAKHGPLYTEMTVEIKEKYGIGLGKETERVTYFMTGEFYNSLYTKAAGESFITDSFDDKADKLLVWSPKALELNQANLDFFAATILLPELQRRFNQQVYGVR